MNQKLLSVAKGETPADLVIRDGNIVEQGRHEDLMRKKGFYAALYAAQFEAA